MHLILHSIKSVKYWTTLSSYFDNCVLFQSTIHKTPDRSGAKSASAALDELLTKTSTPAKNTRKTKSAKTGKKKKGKGGAKKVKKKATPVTIEQLKSPSVMNNAYYICHNAPDFLYVRGFKFKPKSAWETVPPAIKMRLLGYSWGKWEVWRVLGWNIIGQEFTSWRRRQIS